MKRLGVLSLFEYTKKLKTSDRFAEYNFLH